MSRVKAHRANRTVSKKFVQSTGTYEFGPLLIGRGVADMSEPSEDAGDEALAHFANVKAAILLVASPKRRQRVQNNPERTPLDLELLHQPHKKRDHETHYKEVSDHIPSPPFSKGRELKLLLPPNYTPQGC